MNLTYSARLPHHASEVLIPGGVVTPHGTCTALGT